MREEAKENRYARDFHALGIHAIWDMWTELISAGVWTGRVDGVLRAGSGP